MIQKINKDEYLNRVGNMNAAEKGDYLKRVGEWLSNKGKLLSSKTDNDMALFQNALQYSSMWNDNECQAWMEGVRLLTALMPDPDTWLPDRIYQAAAKRTVKQMVRCLSGVLKKAETEPEKPIDKIVVDGKTHDLTLSKGVNVEGASSEEADGKVKEDLVEGTVKETQDVTTQPLPSGATPVVARPKHIDQYIHLLPEKTQEKAAMVRGLLRDLDVARQNMNLLMQANAQSDKLAQWAKTATKLDEKVKSIYSEIDAEWDKLVKMGVVSVDAFGNAVINPAQPKIDAPAETVEDNPTTEGAPKSQEEHTADIDINSAGTMVDTAPTSTETDAVNQSEEQSAETEEKKEDKRSEKKRQENQRKAALLRKFLIDKRNANTKDQQKKWTSKYKEMIKLAGDAAVTDKVREAAEFYGIDINSIKK